MLNIELAKSKSMNEGQQNGDDEKHHRLLDEYKILQQMVLDKDKDMKKLRESHEKDITNLKLEKNASDEALNCATRDNALMKDKENTLLDIFKSMKMFIEKDVVANDNEVKTCNTCTKHTPVNKNWTLTEKPIRSLHCLSAIIVILQTRERKMSKTIYLLSIENIDVTCVNMKLGMENH